MHGKDDHVVEISNCNNNVYLSNNKVVNGKNTMDGFVDIKLKNGDSAVNDKNNLKYRLPKDSTSNL